MKRRRMMVMGVVMGLLVSPLVSVPSHAARAAESGNKWGLGLNLGRADFRFMLDSMSAVDGFVGLSSVDAGGGSKTTDTSIGGYYLKRFFAPDPVDFHFLAGLSFGSGSVGVSVPPFGTLTEKNSVFSIFAGVGSEYFLPGTKQFSLEAEVGLQFDSTSTDVPNPITGGTSSVSGSGFGFRDLTGGLFMLRYYFAN